MQPMHWNIPKLKQVNGNIGQALLSDEQTLVSFRQDFGHVFKTNPAAVFMPVSQDILQGFVQYAAYHKLPVTIRGKGLSQGGQSLAVEGGITLSMNYFEQVEDLEGESIWVEANASWSDVLDKTLPYQRAPFVLPYNCNLSIGGVLSAGGVGASSFKEGLISSHIEALDIIDGQGQHHVVDSSTSLFTACLGGQGRCGIITKARIALKPVASKVKTYFLVYENSDQWFNDIEEARQYADYLELFCSPSVQGAGLLGDKRVPMAQWLYGMHISFEVEGKHSPSIHRLKPWKILHQHTESISSYFLRHNGRFEMMKASGQWDLVHPWYECFTPASVLRENLKNILGLLPLHYANLVHVVPIEKRHAGMTVFPEEDKFYSLMILNPGVPEALKGSCLQAIHALDQYLLKNGGKRYLSGYLGENIDDTYWRAHFGERYQEWVDLKKKYDPASIFSSILFNSNPMSTD